MNQVSLVSLYGRKTNDLVTLINRCVGLVNIPPFQHIFTPYKPNQVHGTLIGMEKLVGFSENFNTNTWKETGNKEEMNFDPLVETVKKHLPIQIRFGGIRKNFRRFDSFGKTPYERSFQVQWQTNKLTLIGWPHENGDFTSKRLLEALRLDIATHCKIRHKYKSDNDFFMVLGEINGYHLLKESELQKIKYFATDTEEKVRVYLANNMTEVEIGLDQVFLVQYKDENLPVDSTTAYCIENQSIDADFIRKLYL